MFLRMIRGTLLYQWKKMLLIALTIALGASLATAMISVRMGISDKINSELKTYGANITVVPKQSSIVSNLYDIEDDSNTTGAYLAEDELGNIKTIFWAFNIVDYAPFISTETVLDDGAAVTVVGSWFNHHMDLPTGESLDAGITSLRSWWDIMDGEWLDEQSNAAGGCMVGAELAAEQNLSVGDTVHVTGTATDLNLQVVGIFSCDDTEDGQIYTTLASAQSLGALDGCIDSIEVSALTTPDNDLAKKAAKDPDSLTIAQYEEWYCTAYVSSICYQIQNVITDSVASAVRQVADSEGNILEKTKLLMIMIMIMSLIGSALGISNLVTASVMERSGEIGLMKAIGAHNAAVTALVLTEILVAAVIGGIVGFFMGVGFAQIIGQTVFSSAIEVPAMVIPLVAVAVAAVTLAGSIPAIRMLLGLEPAEVLHAAK